MAARPPSPSSSDDPPCPASTTSPSPSPSPSPSCSEPSSTSSGLSPPSSVSRGRVSPDAGTLAAVSTLEGEVTPGEAQPDEAATSLEARASVASPGSPEPCSSEVSSSSPTGGASPPWAPDSSQSCTSLRECRPDWPLPRPSPATPSSSSWVNPAEEATVSRSTWRAASPAGATSSLSPESLWNDMEGGDVTSTGPPELPEPARACPGDVPSTTSSWLTHGQLNSTQEAGAWCQASEGAWGGYDPWVPSQHGSAEAGVPPPSWRSRATVSLTRVTPTVPPPRPPTPPRQSTPPPPGRARAHSQPLRQSASPPPHGYPRIPSPSGVRRSLSPPTHSCHHTPTRRSSSPAPLSGLHAQPPSPGARPRLSPRPRSARTPSPRPPRPPASAPDPSPASTSQQSPRPHYNKMRGR